MACWFRGTFTSTQLVTWLQAKLEENKRPKLNKKEVKNWKECKIDGSTFMSLEISVLQALEFPLASALFIISLKELIVKCYQVNAKCVGARKMKGIRAAVYKCAEEHHAYYSPIGRSRSIRYDDDDLKVELWFKVESKACDFCCFLATWHQKNPLVVRSGDIKVEEEIKTMLVENGELSAVKLCHYVANDSESPVQSLDQFDACKSSTCSVVSLGTSLAQFQSLEDKDTLQGFRPYVCHVKPKANFEALKNKEYNKIAGSWHFHQMFDGLNTEDLKTGEHDLPLVAVKPLETEIKDEMVGEPARKRTRVGVELEFRDPQYAKQIVLKPGSTKISEIKWRTFVHVEDAKKFCDCLKWKNNHARKKWRQADQFDQLAKDRD